MSVAVSAEALVMLTGVVEPKLTVGGSCAPAGLDVIVAVSATLPVNPPLGVTVIVDWLPVFAPVDGDCCATHRKAGTYRIRCQPGRIRCAGTVVAVS